MPQSIEVGSVLGGRYRITDHVVTSADQDLVFTGLDQVLNRRVTVLVASLENATQVASSARELATGERQDDIQVLDLGLSEGHTYLIAGGNPDPDVLLGLAYPQETYVEPFQTDTLGSEIFGSSRDAEAHEYDDDEAYYTELDERVRADQEQHSRRPGFLNRLSDRLSERMNSSSDGSAARNAAGASALAAAGSAAKAQEEEKRKAEEERRRAEEAERARQEEERRAQEERRREQEAAELERRRARQIEEEERRERAEAERRAAERAEREEREARKAEERAELRQREDDRRREAAAEDTSTAPVPTVAASGPGDDGHSSGSTRADIAAKDTRRDLKDTKDPAADAAPAGTGDAPQETPRRVRPAPRRALAAAAAAGAGATAVAAGTAAAGAAKKERADARDAEGRSDGRRDTEDSGRDRSPGDRSGAHDGPVAGDRRATQDERTPHHTDRADRTDQAGRPGSKAAAGAGAAAGPAAAGAAGTRHGGPGDSQDPRNRADRDERDRKKGGAGWLVALLLVLLLAVALIAGFFLLNGNRDSVPDDNQATATPTESTEPSDDGASPSEDASASPSEDAAAPAEPAARVDIYRQVPDNPPLESQHDGQLPNIIDGDPETFWQSYSYKRPNFGGYTRSMNFVVELEEARDISTVTVESVASSDGQLAVGVASEDGLADLRRGGEGTFVDGKAEVEITDEQGDAKYVVVTVTELPQLALDNSQYAYGLRLSEITVD